MAPVLEESTKEEVCSVIRLLWVRKNPPVEIHP
jgi:hypothetical protein